MTKPRKHLTSSPRPTAKAWLKQRGSTVKLHARKPVAK